MDNIKNQVPLSEREIQAARQEFVREYASSVGWDAQNLTESQYEKIKRLPGWKAAGMLKS